MGSNPAIPTTGSDRRSVVVLGAAGAVGAAVCSGLAATGCLVAAVDDDGVDSGAEYAAALRAAAPQGISAVVDAGFLRSAPSAGALAGLGSGEWLEVAEQPLRRALHVLQGAHRCLAAEGGRLIVLLPSLVMSGAAGVVGWAAAAEGYRSLGKAAARAWGLERVTVTSVLVPAGLLVDSTIDRPGLQPPALGRTPDPQAEIAPAIAALLDERLDAVTGLTVAVDGGVWMTS